MDNIDLIQLFLIFITVYIAINIPVPKFLRKFFNKFNSKDSSIDDPEKQKDKNLIETGFFETDEERQRREIFTNAAKSIIDDKESVIGKLLSAQELVITDLDFKTKQLNDRTKKFEDILSNPQDYGDWGELTLDKLLELVEYKKNIHYFRKQPLEEDSNLIPDFTFKLPENKIIHLDSKVNLAGYDKIKNLQDKLTDALDQSEIESINLEISENVKKFVKASKKSVDDISKKYKDHLGDNTVDYVFMYIPKESIYSFLIEQSVTIKDSNKKDTTLPFLEYTLKKNVVITNPSLMMSYLSTIRQAVETFNIKSNVKEIISIQREFLEEWVVYKEAHNDIKKTLEKSVKDWDDVAGDKVSKLEAVVKRMQAFVKESEEETKESD